MSTGKIKKWLEPAGRILMLLSLLFIAKRLYQYRTELVHSVNEKALLISAGYMLILAASVLVNSVLYHRLVGLVSGKETDRSLVMSLYVKSNLYKYLPGNVMHLIGRNQIAGICDIPHRDVAFCTLTELAISCIASGFISLIFAFPYVLEYLSGHPGTIRWVGLLLLAALVLLSAAVVFLKKRGISFSAALQRLRGGAGFLLLMVLINCLWNVLYGGSFLLLLRSMQPQSASAGGLRIIGVYAFSWLIGFITPGAPGGLGIREAMLMLCLEGTMSADVITAAVMINRIAGVLGDVLAFMVLAVSGHWKKRENRGRL